MAQIFRVERTKNFTVMSNHHFKNKNLTLKAKGLLSLMLSLPDDWNYNMQGLATLSRDGIDSVRSAIKELEHHGYVERHRLRNEYGGDGMNKSWETDTFHFLKEHHAPYGLMNGYGMTEMAGPVCTSNHKFPVMLPFFCNNIKILDIDTGEELGYEQEGEICVSGPSMMMEYYKNPEATREIIFEENGTRWLRTGDLGHVTKEGYFRLTGRLKRILWSIGADKTPSRVYPMEIENVLSRHSAVDKCAVVGRLNGEKGYLVIAYVTLKSKDTGDNVEKELRQLCSQELKENSWPFEYHFVEKLPTTGAGKIDFRTLEKWAENSDSF